MNDAKDVNLNDLVKRIHKLCPSLPNNEEFNNKLLLKLQEQLKEKVPKVELEQLDLNYIILNVKKSLSEIQRRIDESVAKQQLRRTTRVRKTIPQDPAVADFFWGTRKNVPSQIANKAVSNSSCINGKCCHKEYELGDLVQVESLPVSASTNLLTIFVPSILQEKLHCKYKISINLNRLDLTKKILDLNVGQLEVELKDDTIEKEEIDTNKNRQDPQEIKMTYEIKDDNAVQLQTINTTENNPHVEVKSSPGDTAESTTTLKPTVSIMTEHISNLPSKKRGSKRKTSKPQSNIPPKKRGRKPGSKNKSKNEKSEIAKYVEMFECNGNSPSSAVSQNVTSTTQPWELIPNQVGQIAYYMNGEWTLCDPSNSARQLVSTSNVNINLEDAIEQDPGIPFEDFVNYIESPSLDVENNVIARVLDATIDTTAQVVTNSHGQDMMRLEGDIQQNPNNVETSQSFQFGQSTSKQFGGMESSNCRETSKNSNSDKESLSNVLDLTKKTTNKLSCDRDKKNLCTESNVIFSTSRNMPSLDDEDVDSLCSTPQQDNNSQKKVVYSMEPHTSQLYVEKNILSSPQQDDEKIGSGIEITKKDSSHLTREVSLINATEMSHNISTHSNDKKGDEEIKELSLLELEKDFDNTLMDLSSYLDDDLLSLAPSSCFNSPIDDRYAGSKYTVMDESETKPCSSIKVSKNFPLSAPRSHLETDVLKCKEDDLNPALKSFKIPRMETARKSSAEPSLEKLPAEKVSKPFDGGNISNHSDSCLFSIRNPIVMSNADSSIASPNVVSTLEISKIFGSICFGFLADMCFESPCKFNHQLIDANIISVSLSLLRNEVLHSAYRFIWRHYKLFKFYFKTFCEEYGHRNMRHKLSNMVHDCEIQPKCFHFLQTIFTTLTNCGFSRVNACRFILGKVKDRSNQAIDVLLQLIIDSDAQMFVATIEEFSNIKGYKFQMKSINEMTKVCLRLGNTELIPVLMKCLINVDQTEFLTMRSPELIQLLEMIKNSGGR